MERPENKWSLLDWLILLIVLVPMLASVLVYDQLPDQMVAHFDTNMQPDRYQDKLSLLLTVSVISLLPLLLKFLRRLDPKKENYAKFQRAFNIFRLAIALLFSVSYGLLLLYALGYEEQISMRLIVFTMLGLLFMVLGNYMGQIRPNYFTGIRTPWTLASDEVWRKTHRLAGPLWMIGGLIFLVTAFLPGISVPPMLGVLVAVTIVVPCAASYYYFRKMQ